MWAAVGASVAGTSHLARSTPCQDAVRSAAVGPAGDWMAVAAADGAGTAAHADVGAARACEVLIALAAAADPATLTADGVREWFAQARADVAAAADRHGVPARELACTALLAVVGPAGAVFGQIGDGAIVAGGGAGRRVVFWPEPGEYANATDFLTDAGFAAAVRVEVATDPVTELAVLTDGLQRLALDFATRAPHPPFFDPLFAAVRAADPADLADPLRAFLDSPRVNDRTDDDKTLFLAVRRP